MTRAGVVLCLALASCGVDPPGPAPLDTRTEHCRSCQMPVSDVHTAAQIVAPGEDPLFFDDLACLATYLTRSPLPAGATIFVADHQTGQWVDARVAAFSTVAGLATPMASGIVAHATAGARAADLGSREYHEVAREDVLGTTRGAGDAR